MYNRYSDLELMQLLKEGDQKAFTEIYHRYWKKLLLMAWNLSNRSDHAKDIVHEVFMSLWERRNTIEIQNPAAWLATSVKFSLFKYFQKEYRRTQLARENCVFDEASYDEQALDAIFLQEYIDGIVEEMPEKCKLVFKYSRDLGLKNTEIAQKVHISEKGVEANLTRALRILRSELKDYGLTIVVLLAHCISWFK